MSKLQDVTGFIYTHDPVIIKDNSHYYRFQTGSSIPISISDDLKDWKLIGKVFSSNPSWTSMEVPGSTDFWAPEVVKRNGEWRIYYSVSTFGKNTSSIGLCTLNFDKNDPTKFFVKDRGSVIHSTPDDNYNCIDPAVICDDDGRDYLVFGSFWGGINMTLLDCNGMVADKSSLTNIAIRKAEFNPVEGAFIFRHNDYYYLFASHDFCCRGTASTYHIVYGRSKEITGPYIDEKGISMTDGGGTTLRDGFSFKRWAGPGHNSIFSDDDGKIYLVYHAYDRQDDGRSKLMIEEIGFDQDWIVLDD